MSLAIGFCIYSTDTSFCLKYIYNRIYTKHLFLEVEWTQKILLVMLLRTTNLMYGIHYLLIKIVLSFHKTNFQHMNITALKFCMSFPCIIISCWFVCCFSQFQLWVGRQWQHLLVRRWVWGWSENEISGGAGYSRCTQAGHGKQGT